MKPLVLMFVLSIFVGTNAQNKQNKDKIIETKTRIITVIENGELVEKKIKVRTKKLQDVKTNAKSKGTSDRAQVFPPTEVSKIIYLDNDNDPFYDKFSEITYYQHNGKVFNFDPTNTGFEIINAETNQNLANARFSNSADVYFLDTKNYSGIGYFKKNQFIIEYYNDEGILIVERFSKKK